MRSDDRGGRGDRRSVEGLTIPKVVGCYDSTNKGESGWHRWLRIRDMRGSCVTINHMKSKDPFNSSTGNTAFFPFSLQPGRVCKTRLSRGTFFVLYLGRFWRIRLATEKSPCSAT